MDEIFMKMAIDLARKGEGKVNPNPLVGAVIVKEGKVIGEGYHEEYGKSHAEINAFKSANESVEGAVMYVTLEPCSHYGKTPPCAEKIIQNKVSRVVIGMIDPNPLVAGKGVKMLMDAGIEVLVGVLEDECIKLNEVFIKYITTKQPFVMLKAAMSLDGKIATSTGESKWITCDKSRILVHSWRNKLLGIMVGVNTIIRDNPNLTCRNINGRNPYRIIVDSNLRTPTDSNVIQNNHDLKTVIATTNKCPEEKVNELTKFNIKVIKVNDKDGRVDLNELMIELGKLNIDGILLEGGATLNFSALQENIVDKISIFIAPKIIGGENSKTPVGGKGIELLSDSINIKDMSYSFIGKDILVEGYL